MHYEETFTADELMKIIDEGLIYMCACPAQLADAIRKVRGLYDYQKNCLLNTENTREVHQAIEQSAIRAHAELQSCLEQILVLEHWDRATLTMPEGLRARQISDILGN